MGVLGGWVQAGEKADYARAFEARVMQYSITSGLHGHGTCHQPHMLHCQKPTTFNLENSIVFRIINLQLNRMFMLHDSRWSSYK